MPLNSKQVILYTIGLTISYKDTITPIPIPFLEWYKLQGILKHTFEYLNAKANASISGFLQFIMQTRVDLGAHLNPQSLENVNIPEGGQL